MFSKIHSAQTCLLKAHVIDVETDLSKGLHAFSIVGLPDKAVEEAKDRVGAALKNSGFESPKSKNEKIVISLAPADVKKEGPAFDVAIALGYLLSSELIDFDPRDKIFLGELSLDGTVRGIAGVLPLVVEAARRGFKEAYVPKANAREAALVRDIRVFGVGALEELIRHLDPKAYKTASAGHAPLCPEPTTLIESALRGNETDFDDIEGNDTAKRGLVIAAAGGHNIALYGPPGTGKTMLAKALSSILPPLSFEEMIEVTAIHSIAGTLDGDPITAPPVRTPHHTASYVSLVGGGAMPRPGEMTLAHRGVLFLDEFPEFDRRVVETLRQPLEERVVSVSRARGTAHFPARFLLVAAMNPCPCGNFGAEGKICVCPPQAIIRYQRKISGPIMDRIDIWIEVAKVDHEKIIRKKERRGETLGLRETVLRARAVQKDRFGREGSLLNADIKARSIHEKAKLERGAEEALEASAKTLDLSARACHRIMRLARTIADLEGSATVLRDHVLEAIQYRPKKMEI